MEIPMDYEAFFFYTASFGDAVIGIHGWQEVKAPAACAMGGPLTYASLVTRDLEGCSV